MGLKTKIAGGILLLMGLVIFFGPKPQYPSYNNLSLTIDQPIGELSTFVQEKESKIKDLRPNNESVFIWANPRQKTEYALVFLHGFSASPQEGSPIFEEMAARYGMNAYAPLLAGHGINSKESFAEISPRDLIESAKEAIAIGKKMGEKVILLSCSTGSTLGIYLSAADPSIAGHIMYSPNIDLFDTNSRLLTAPWGEHLAYKVIGKYRGFEANEEVKKYWTNYYRVEGLVALKYLLTETMTEEVFKKIEHPIFLGYYYENEEQRDKVVSIERMKDFLSQVTTPKSNLESFAFTTVKAHSLGSKYWSKDLDIVRQKTYDFAEAKFGLQPIENKPTIDEE